MQTQLNAGLLSGVVHLHHRRLQQVVQGDALDIVQLRQRIQARQSQKLIDQAGCAIDTLVKLRQRFIQPLRIVLRKLGYFSLHLQRRQWTAQFVGRIGCEATLADHGIMRADKQLI